MKSASHKHVFQKGFSLVEMLVYLGVTVLVMYAGVSTFLSLRVVIMRNVAERTLTYEGSLVLERMVRDIRASTNVDTGTSILGNSPGTLTLVASPTTTTFTLTGNTVTVSVNGGAPQALTDNGVTVQDLTFTRYMNGNTELVRAGLTLSVNSRYAPSTRTYYISAVPRGRYK